MSSGRVIRALAIVLNPALLVVLVAVASACGEDGGGGGSSGSAIDARYLEADLPKAIAENYWGSSFSNVKCIEVSEVRFECVGDYRMSRAAAERSMKGINTSNFREADWQVIIEQNSGSVSYLVTVDRDDGSYIYRPQ